MIKKLTCVCCGAPINRVTSRCEYCGTEYDLNDEIPTIKLETFTNPVKEYSACVLIDKDIAAMNGEDYMKYAIEQLAREMLPAVIEGMQIKAQSGYDYEAIRTNMLRIDGRIKMVIPKTSGWR